MDLTSNNTHTLDSDTKTPPPTQPTNTNTLKSLSLTNGTHNNNHHRHQSTTRLPPPSMAVISYKECLKNHAASIGGHALDGCGEFMPSSSTNPTDPRSLKCAACGCHRNFHRRDPPEPSSTTTPTFLNCFYSPSTGTTTAPPPAPPQPLPHRGMSQSTSPSQSSSPSQSPSPMSSPSSPPPLSHVPPPPPPSAPGSYHSSAPHMLLALGTAYSAVPSDHEHQQLHRNSFNNSNNFSPVVLNANSGGSNSNSSKNKRYRTKFSQEQKEKMYRFSEKLGWRMNNKGDDSLVQEFCNDIGVPRGVFKVWMHNNKNTFNKKRSSSSEPPLPPPAAAGNNHINDHDQKINATAAADGSNNNNKNGDINNVVSHVPINALSS
ncbi:zinc-finger homeodomain protein 9 [Arachis hypogaea]|uniref:zinc-finger homeodomain protein 9 n=1 Tax=Arachis hypogaea TaxID=3818 RepID=UPI000DEC57AE|nr:zinc-finger homeodomain protein 8 [Arachis hypogaea]QHO03350.1 Zinc-finger homeodomain protein [Arachis hypogaea]